jgi:hypothetical protein
MTQFHTAAGQWSKQCSNQGRRADIPLAEVQYMCTVLDDAACQHQVFELAVPPFPWCVTQLGVVRHNGDPRVRSM